MRLTTNSELNEELNKKSLTDNLKKLDRSFLNSVLSYGVYVKNASWYETWYKSKVENPNTIFNRDEFVRNDKNFNKEKLYDRAFAALIANKLNTVNLDLKNEDQHISKNYLYDFDSKYENGVYKSLNNLAGATAATSKNGDGTHTLHVSFRGTDKDAQPFLNFFFKAYLDMAAYYDSCKPFEEAVLKYAQDPNNKITKIEVSGHSLGGAMVQHFFRSPEVKAAKLSQEIEGFTYGSPPAIANALYGFFPAIHHVLTKGNFKNMMKTAFSIFSGEFLLKEERITQYQHVGDIVPKVGNLLMEKSGKNIVTLKDSASSEDTVDYLLTGSKENKIPTSLSKKSTDIKCKSFLAMSEQAGKNVFKDSMKFLIRMSQVVYHDMARYCVNTHAEINKIKKEALRNPKNNDLNYNFLCPNANNFDIMCSSMRLKYQSKSKMLGFSPDFNQSADFTSNMSKTASLANLLSLRKKMLSNQGLKNNFSFAGK